MRLRRISATQQLCRCQDACCDCASEVDSLSSRRLWWRRCAQGGRSAMRSMRSIGNHILLARRTGGVDRHRSYQSNMGWQPIQSMEHCGRFTTATPQSKVKLGCSEVDQIDQAKKVKLGYWVAESGKVAVCKPTLFLPTAWFLVDIGSFRSLCLKESVLLSFGFSLAVSCTVFQINLFGATKMAVVVPFSMKYPCQLII